MPKLLNKTLSSLKTEGLSKTLTKIVRYPIVRYPFTLNGEILQIFTKRIRGKRRER